MIHGLLLGFLLCGLAACGDDPMGPEDVAGTYTLLTVDGDGAPFREAISPGGEDGSTEGIRTTAGNVVLAPPSTCEFSLTVETASSTDSGSLWASRQTT
jgi:hypothetical protein